MMRTMLGTEEKQFDLNPINFSRKFEAGHMLSLVAVVWRIGSRSSLAHWRSRRSIQVRRRCPGVLMTTFLLVAWVKAESVPSSCMCHVSVLVDERMSIEFI